MAEPSTQADSAHDDHHTNYVKVWAILLALLVVSVVGPMAGIKALTLITAFGIAVVKAYLVAKNFMHINIEPKYVAYLLLTCVTFMLLLFAGVAPDVMHHEGQQWVNLAAKAETARAMSAGGEGQAPAAPMAPDVAFATICASCHGVEGDGTGAAAAALNPKPANLRAPEFWETRDATHIAKVIQNGGTSVGRSALMPAFGGQFDAQSAQALADYIVETFKPADAPAPDEVAADAGADQADQPNEAPAPSQAPAPSESPRVRKPARTPPAPSPAAPAP